MSCDVSTRPCIERPDPLHPRAVAAVEHFPCQALEGRVSDISQREGYSWHLNSNAAEQRLSTIRVIRSSEELRAAVAGQRLWAGSHEGKSPKFGNASALRSSVQTFPVESRETPTSVEINRGSLWRVSGAVPLSVRVVAALSPSRYAAPSDRRHARGPASATLSRFHQTPLDWGHFGKFIFSRAASASASPWVPSEASVAPSTPHVS